jgi:hypothetical protein
VAQELMEEARLLKSHRLDHRVGFAAFPFHGVGRQGPRGSHESQDGGGIPHIAPQSPQHFPHEGQGLFWNQWPQGIDLGLGANGRLDQRALALDDVEINPHPWQGGEDVGEQNHPIRLEGVKGLHRNLIREIGVFRAFPEARVTIPQVAVHLHVPPGLPHHPHRRSLHRFPSGGAQQEGERFGHGSEAAGIRMVENLAEHGPQPVLDPAPRRTGDAFLHASDPAWLSVRPACGQARREREDPLFFRQSWHPASAIPLVQNLLSCRDSPRFRDQT